MTDRNGGRGPLMISCVAPRAVADALAGAWEDYADAVSTFEISPDGDWRVEAYGVDRTAIPEIHASIALLGSIHGGRLIAPEIAPIPDVNWVAENQASFRPLRIGRFHVRPSHDATCPAAGAHVITLDANIAFGTGEHATTRGCLLALDRLARCTRPRRILDMGCGTGILAMAMALQWRRPVLAVDIDPDAVRVTAANAAANGLARLVRPRQGARCDQPVVTRYGRYDLIVANILARPLMTLAPGLVAQLNPGGRVILSGLLADQQAMVLSAYRCQGLSLARRTVIDGWATLELSRPARAAG